MQKEPKVLRATVTGTRRRPVRGQRKSRFSLSRLLLRLVWWVVRPREFTWGLAILAIAALQFGTPHILWTHRCTDRGTVYAYCDDCVYWGQSGRRVYGPGNGDCPFFKFYPLDWKED